MLHSLLDLYASWAQPGERALSALRGDRAGRAGDEVLLLVLIGRGLALWLSWRLARAACHGGL